MVLIEHLITTSHSLSSLPAVLRHKLEQNLPPPPTLEELWFLYEDLREMVGEGYETARGNVMAVRSDRSEDGRKRSSGRTAIMVISPESETFPASSETSLVTSTDPTSDAPPSTGHSSSQDTHLTGTGPTARPRGSFSFPLGMGIPFMSASSTTSIGDASAVTRSCPSSPTSTTRTLPSLDESCQNSTTSTSSHIPTHHHTSTSNSKRRRLSLPYIRRRLLPLLHTLLIMAILATTIGIVDDLGWRLKLRLSGAGTSVSGAGHGGMDGARQRWRVPEWMDTGWLHSVSGGRRNGEIGAGFRDARLGTWARRTDGSGSSEHVRRVDSSAGGQSSISSLPKPMKRRRILFLTDYRDHLERMNTNTYEIIDAALRLDPSSASYGTHPSYIPEHSPGMDFDRHPDLELDVDVWGPGWAGWSSEIPASENVRRRSWRGEARRARRRRVEAAQAERLKGLKVEREEEGSWSDGWKDWWTRKPKVQETAEVGQAEDGTNSSGLSKDRADDVFDVMNIPGGCPLGGFDFVWTFSDIFKQGDPLLDPMPCGSVLVQQLGDCHSLNCLKEWYPNVSNITLTKYGFELLDVFSPKILEDRFPEMEMQLFGYSADSANEWDFWPVEEAGWRQQSGNEGKEGGVVVETGKKVDAMMFGYTMPFYPIRSTVHDAVESTRPHLIQRYEHPGYYVWETQDAYDHPLDTYVEGSEVYAQHRMKRSDFAKAMRETKICVFDSSVERKMIRKYAQAMLSGCVVAADLPTEHEHELEEFMIVLDPDWDIERIEAVVRSYLDRPELLAQMAKNGLDFARRRLTNTRKIVDAVRIVDAYKVGKRGYDLPYGVSLLCRSYWYEQDSWKPPWCEAGPASHRGGERRSID